MAVTTAAIPRRRGALVRGEVTRREAAAKGLGVTDTPPLTSPAIDGASEDTGRAIPFRADVPIADHALRGAAGNRSAVIVEIAGTAHEGAGLRTGHPIQLVEVVGQISAERKRTAERVLTGQLAGGRHRAAKGEASGGDAPVEVVDAEVAGTRIEIPIHIHVAGGVVGHPAVAANVGGDVAEFLGSALPWGEGRQSALRQQALRRGF